jgi:aspartate--ammonia ligase
LPPKYAAKLGVMDTEKAIRKIKRDLERHLSEALNLRRMSAPLFLRPETGLNDDLNGVERPVDLVLGETGDKVQIVQSLAKWKRWTLGRYGFRVGEGLVTDMRAIRKDDLPTSLHSNYVDEWDWEVVIRREDRNRAFLTAAVRKVVGAIADTLDDLKAEWPTIDLSVSRDVHVVTSQELEDEMPDRTPKSREDEIARRHGTVFVMGIGDRMRSGNMHDRRAPDYDDWTLNGDVIFWNGLLGCAIELSNMGIRVDAATMDRQIEVSGCEDRRSRTFQRMVLEDRLPQSMGGGINQSRLCMFLLQKAHIGEVQCSVWPEEMAMRCRAAGIELL